MSFITALISSKIALGALGVAVVAAGGTAAVAVTAHLPEASQGIVHTASATPDPTESATVPSTETVDSTDAPTPVSSPTSSPTGPDATGAAAFGLCTAFTHGGLAAKSTAYGSLVTAASGAENIASYCDTVVAPGKAASHRANDSSSTPEAGDTSSAPESEDSTSHSAVAPAVPAQPSQAATGANHKKSGRP